MRTENSLKDYLSWAEVLPETCNTKINYLLAIYFSSYSLYAESLKQLLLVLNKAPQWWELYERLAWLGFKIKDFSFVHQKLRKAIEEFPEKAPVWTSWGITFLFEENVEKAKEKFQKALELNPFSEMANLGAGLTELKKLNLSQPKVNIDEIISKIKNSEKLFLGEKDFSLALKLLEAKRTKEAEEKLMLLFYSLLEFEPFDQFDQFLLDFLLHRDQADFASLKKGMEKLENSEIQKATGELHNKLGISYLLLIGFLLDESKRQLSQAASLNPQFTKALRNAKLLEEAEEKLSVLFESIKL